MNWQPGTCSTRGRTTPPRAYLRSAMEKYEAWGAKRKVAHLKSRYPGLIADDRAEATSPSANLDLGTMLKASEAISSTLELEPLLEILLRILMEMPGPDSSPDTGNRRSVSHCCPRSAEQVECFSTAFPACGKGPIPLPLDHLLGETNPGTPGFGQRFSEERFIEDDYIRKEAPQIDPVRTDHS